MKELHDQERWWPKGVVNDWSAACFSENWCPLEFWHINDNSSMICDTQPNYNLVYSYVQISTQE
jgi:hypothetical protein